MSWTVGAPANLQKVNLKQGRPAADQTSQIAKITPGGADGLVARLGAAVERLIGGGDISKHELRLEIP
jgi:hypothetical protein